MQRRRTCRILALLAAAASTSVRAQTTINGASLIQRSSGASTGSTSWVLGSNGYVGTYVTLPSAGTVTLAISASGQADAGIAPHMDIVVDDSDASFTVAASTSNYSTTLSLPAGTHFVRTQFTNAAANRKLTIANLQVTGATVSNSDTTTNALAAANTYITNFRKGNATIALTGPSGIPLLAGTSVPVDMARNAFNFGGTVSGSSIGDSKDMLSPVNNTGSTSEAAQFQSFINQYFNTIVPSNGGKWANNEPTQNNLTMQLVDEQLNYAKAHNMRERMHNLIWGSGSMSGNQQPTFVNTLIASAAGGNAAAQTTLRNDIASRINYYVGTNGNRSQNYIELDVLNEALHNPSYWNIYNPTTAGSSTLSIASIYNDVAAAAKAAGNPNVKLDLNEYNVLQFSPSTISAAGVESGSDQYANWYRNEVEAVKNAGGAVSGIGMQEYVSLTATGSNAHSAATIQKALQNLSVEGLPLTMAEYGHATGTTSANAQSLGPQAMDDAVRMFYGNPLATTFMVWGWWDTSASIATNGAPPAQMIVTTPGSSTYTLTALGQKWVSLMNEFSTHLTATVNAGGTIGFNGFYGDYNIGTQSGFSNMTLAKGTTQYGLSLAAPPQWSFWNANNSGTWGSGVNWTTAGVANAVGQTAYFGSAASARTVSVDSPKTVGMLAFDSSSKYTIGGSTITLQGAAGQAAIYVANGSHQIDAPLALSNDTTITVAPVAATLAITNLQSSTIALTKAGAGMVVLNNVRAGSLNVSAGTLRIAANGTNAGASSVGAMTIAGSTDAWAAALDLANNSLAVNYTGVSPLASIQNQIKSGSANGAWNGPGITSSSAQAVANDASNSNKTALGFVDSGTQVLIEYTTTGDANLDGVTNALDYNAVASNFGSTSATWTTGDFNYDGVVNTLDFNMLANNFSAHVPAPSASIAQATLVPEPSAMAIIGLGLAGLLRRRRRIAMLGWAIATTVGRFSVNAQTTTLSGSSLAMASQSSATLGSTGFVGTYLVVPAGGATVNLTINSTEASTGAGTPHMQLVIADTTASFNIASTSAANYTTSNITLPAGTYAVRDERDFTGNVGVSRALTVNNLSVNTVSGSTATFLNTNDGTTALAASDTYINNFRKGPATVALTGPGNIPLLAGTSVNVDLARIGFNFGTAVPGSSPSGVNTYLGTNALGVGTTVQQQQYQAHLLQNFNTVVPENMGKWGNDESTQGNTANMSGIDTILNYAQKNHMNARMHNVIWGSQQPGFATTLLSQAAAGSMTSQTTLRNDITSRIGYYVGTGTASDRSTKYQQLDVYNESYHTGSTVAGSYWNVYTPTGIADIYRQIHAVAPNVALFTNEYNIYEDGADKYASWYQQHIEQLRNAGIAAGYGDVVGGVGTQYYPDNTTSVYTDPNSPSVSGSAHDPARVMQTLQNLSTEGLPITLTEFGVKPPNASGAGAASMSLNASTQQSAASIMADTMRLVFGNANSTGFTMWGFQAEGSGTTFGTNLFQSQSALYTVTTTGANAWAASSWTLTPAGQAWQTLLGIQNFNVSGSDGKLLQQWTTHLDGAGAPTVGPDGKINFNGFYGDYNIAGQSGFSNLSLAKGTTQYSLNLQAPPQWSLWNTANSGTWGNAGNWTTGGVANAAGQTAYFGSALGATAITVDGAKTVGMLAFNSAAAYTIGGSTISLQGTAAQAAIYDATGSHEIDAPLNVIDNTTVTVSSPGDTLTISNFQPTNAILTKSGAGMLVVNHLAAGGLSINAGTVKATTGVHTVNSLTIAGGMDGWLGKLDLADSSMIVNYTGASPMATIQNQIKNGLSNGVWTGMGITSSAAATIAADGSNPNKTALGVAEASSLGISSFRGQPISGSAIVIAYTLAGDANLDGSVNALDFNAVASNFGAASPTWTTGDFNYDGIVNSMDFVDIAANFNAPLILPAALPGSLVPEPSLLVLAGVVPFLLRSRRRRIG